MSWGDVGDWIKENAGTGAGLVGSLLTGNLRGAIAAGVSLVSSATGTDDPIKALAALQSDPATMIRLKELANQEEQSIRQHIAKMTEMDLQDKQHEHATTQATIQAGDKAQDRFVRWTRPGQSWISLAAGIGYAFTDSPNEMTLGLLLTLPFAYAGLRQVGKGIDSVVTKKANH